MQFPQRSASVQVGVTTTTITTSTSSVNDVTTTTSSTFEPSTADSSSSNNNNNNGGNNNNNNGGNNKSPCSKETSFGLIIFEDTNKAMVPNRETGMNGEAAAIINQVNSLLFSYAFSKGQQGFAKITCASG